MYALRTCACAIVSQALVFRQLYHWRWIMPVKTRDDEMLLAPRRRADGDDESMGSFNNVGEDVGEEEDFDGEDGGASVQRQEDGSGKPKRKSSSSMCALLHEHG